LYNQVVKVLRLAGNPAYAEPCYLIELPDKTRAELPCSWAAAIIQAETALANSTPEIELWAGVEEYLALASLVQAMLAGPGVEESGDERDEHNFTPNRGAGEWATGMGAVSTGVPERVDPGVGGAAATFAAASGAGAGDGVPGSGS